MFGYRSPINTLCLLSSSVMSLMTCDFFSHQCLLAHSSTLSRRLEPGNESCSFYEHHFSYVKGMAQETIKTSMTREKYGIPPGSGISIPHFMSMDALKSISAHARAGVSFRTADPWARPGHVFLSARVVPVPAPWSGGPGGEAHPGLCSGLWRSVSTGVGATRRPSLISVACGSPRQPWQQPSGGDMAACDRRAGGRGAVQGEVAGSPAGQGGRPRSELQPPRSPT